MSSVNPIRSGNWFDRLGPVGEIPVQRIDDAKRENLPRFANPA